MNLVETYAQTSAASWPPFSFGGGTIEQRSGKLAKRKPAAALFRGRAFPRTHSVLSENGAGKSVSLEKLCFPVTHLESTLAKEYQNKGL